MSGQMRTKRYQVLVERDGEECNFCGNGSEVRQLVIDHRNNDNTNNEYENLQLLCRRCNKIKKHTRTVDKYVKSNKEETPIEINKRKEPLFREIVYRDLLSMKQKEFSDLVNEGAEILGLSPVTTKRYLEKLCSYSGVCKKIGSSVELNPESPFFTIEFQRCFGDSKEEHIINHPLLKKNRKG